MIISWRQLSALAGGVLPVRLYRVRHAEMYGGFFSPPRDTQGAESENIIENSSHLFGQESFIYGLYWHSTVPKSSGHLDTEGLPRARPSCPMWLQGPAPRTVPVLTPLFKGKAVPAFQVAGKIIVLTGIIVPITGVKKMTIDRLTRIMRQFIRTMKIFWKRMCNELMEACFKTKFYSVKVRLYSVFQGTSVLKSDNTEGAQNRQMFISAEFVEFSVRYTYQVLDRKRD